MDQTMELRKDYGDLGIQPPNSHNVWKQRRDRDGVKILIYHPAQRDDDSDQSNRIFTSMSEFVYGKQAISSKLAMDAQLTPLLRLGAGACAGIIAMSATYPLDMMSLIKPSASSWKLPEVETCYLVKFSGLQLYSPQVESLKEKVFKKKFELRNVKSSVDPEPVNMPS
ncbi:hypothetical protein DCAR_0310576 [Daucus carota subsp. sativus]|uniref:Uncharacterized protein n=1 Tax=Daucus carota subsp. sativus TaxID=79200 RepID=A0A166A035_DAUCS|nr:hypothetical protein DCAR_0310576 [Daucus carota subsp. sativus]